MFNSALKVAEYLLQNANISVVPWDDSGHYLRFSVTFEASSVDDEIKIMNELRKRLKVLDFIF